MNSKIAFLLQVLNWLILIASRVVQIMCVCIISYVLESPTIALLGGLLLGFLWVKRDTKEQQ